MWIVQARLRLLGRSMTCCPERHMWITTGVAVDADTLLLSDYEIKVRYYADTMHQCGHDSTFLTVQSC